MHAAIIRAVKPDEMTPESHPTQLLTEMAARPGG
jgi:hypothetical protein